MKHAHLHRHVIARIGPRSWTVAVHSHEHRHRADDWQAEIDPRDPTYAPDHSVTRLHPHTAEQQRELAAKARVVG
jgi:hypothetical protein